MAKVKKKGGTFLDREGNPGASECMLEMGMELTDPAQWAAIQLCKPTADRPSTYGEAVAKIRGIFVRAIEMEKARLQLIPAKKAGGGKQK